MRAYTEINGRVERSSAFRRDYDAAVRDKVPSCARCQCAESCS